MTVYYYDLFTGTAGTLLTSHTADSGATWPNDADHYYGTGIVTLDGLGGVYQSNTGSSINLSSAAMPSTQNFEVLFSYIRKTSIAANAGLIFLSSSWPTIADCYELFYAEGDGWLLYHTSISGSTNTLLAGPYAGPAFGVTWYMKVDVSTSGGNTTFTVYYSIASTGPFTQLFSYTAATSTDLVAVGTRFYNPSTASTVTTGQHIGALTVQDIPALSSVTLSGPTQQLFSNPAEFTVGLNEPPGTGGVVVTPASSNGSDTLQATQGGANVTSSTLAAGQPSGTYWLTPGVATGNRTIPITASPTLTCPNSPFTYDALPAATGYTATGATGGHQLVPVTWTITLIGGDFAGTITATPGGGTGQCQIFSPLVITFTGNGTLSKTFSFTPLDVDSVTFTFTNSGSLTNPSPATYVSTGIYYKDTFTGSAGTSIASHTSNTLPSGLAGSGYTVTGSGTIELDGNGLTFLSATGNTYAITEATLPTWSSTVAFEVLFDIENITSVSGAECGIALITYSGNVYNISFNSGGNIIQFYVNDSTFAVYTTTTPAPGVLWHMKFDWVGDGGIYPSTYLWYSTDNVTWNTLWSNSGPVLASDISPVVAVGPYMQGTAVTATTGVHVGNIVVQDIAPPTPNCQISKAYVASSGQSVAFFFETVSGGESVIPTAMNYAPSFFRNGVSIGIGVNAFVTGTTSCAILQFENNLQVNPGDIITVSTPASWMTCGVGNAANHVANLGIINNTGVSCFGADALEKTFKPGLNISFGGIDQSTSFNIFANLRYRLPAPPYNWGASVDGYPTALEYPTTTLDFYDFNPSNGIDSTLTPGVPGYYAIGYDDLAYGTSNQCNLALIPTYAAWLQNATITTSVSGGVITGVTVINGGSGWPVSSTTIPVAILGTGYGARAIATSDSSGAITTVTLTAGGSGYTSSPAVLINVNSIVEPIATCNNPGSGGIGQFYLFNVAASEGSPVANIPVTLQWNNPGGGLQPQISNLYILGPGDFTVPSLTNTSWTFPRPAGPGPLSNQFLSNLANGVGCLRWLDSVLGLGSSGVANMCEPWEMHQLVDFSWDNSNYVNSTITVTTVRPLTTANSPYLYSDFFGSPWTAGSGLGGAISGAVTGSGTVSVVHGSTTITFSTSQSGLAGLSLVIAGDLTGIQFQIASGSSKTWTLATTYWGVSNAAASWSTLQTTITVASAATDPLFYGLLLLIDSEKMRVRGVSGTSVWVERGASGTTPAAHSSGTTITIYSRYAWTVLTTFGSGATQILEFVTSTPHGFKAGQYFQPGGSLPTMTCTDGSTVIMYNEAVWPTGPNSFVQVMPVTTTGAVTLSTSYTLSGCTITNQSPAAGFPHDAIAIATGAIPGANIHVPLPMLASDSYCYNVANKILSNFPAGRRVYVELADEPWNFAISLIYQSQFLSMFNGYSHAESWYVIRAGQIRTIFRNVFGSRANEIYMMLNIQGSAPDNGAQLFGSISSPGIATSNNLIFDAYAIATYISPVNDPVHVAAWNASSIPQMADLFIHDVYYTPANTTGALVAANTNISNYNAWIDANFPGTRHCVLYGYEGGYGTGAPDGCTTCSSGVNEGMGGSGFGNICPALNHDIMYDPLWRIYEKDFYALLQSYVIVDNTLYSYNLYYFYQSCWGMYHWVGQQPGKGDGSDGKANNRLCLATPGYTYSKASTTNQDQQNVSVRGQALLEWMQPAQAKKRMLFFPERFVNR